MTLKKKAVENTVAKGENAGHQHFFPFPTVFSTLSSREIVILATIVIYMCFLFVHIRNVVVL